MSMCQPPLSPELLSMLTDDPRRGLRKLPSTVPLLDRVLLRCVIDSSGCWFFTGAPMADGYASVRMGGKTYRGHHVTFEALVGERQTELWTDHTCLVRRCCNPWHLEEVPPGENTLRGYWANGHPRRTHCQAGHAYAEVGWYTAGKTVKKCAACMRGWMDAQNARRRAARRA